MISPSSLPGLTRQSITFRKKMDARVIGERSDAVLRTAMPAHDGRLGRRAVLSLLGGAAALSLAAGAQQQAMPVIGYLGFGTRASGAHMMGVIRQSLAEAGFVEGRGVTIEPRWADGQYDRLPALAAELVRRPVSLIIATGGSAPAVSAEGGDRDNSDCVQRYRRSGQAGNSLPALPGRAALGAKQLGLLRELVPSQR